MSKFKDLTGKRFGRLQVIRKKERRGTRGLWCWLCQCDCGEERVVYGQDLNKGHTRSCGCLHKELASAANSTHKLSGTRFHNIFTLMKQRCENVHNPAYKNYGSRGIKCLWDSFEVFFEDMGDSYIAHVREHGNNTTIERIDNDGHYCKENCRWATREEQKMNRRNTIFVDVMGQTMTLKRVAEKLGMSYGCLYTRHRRGQPIIK